MTAMVAVASVLFSRCGIEPNHRITSVFVGMVTRLSMDRLVDWITHGRFKIMR
jgi:hypothetical protein